MPPTLADAKHLLVRRWGELGGYWGISRTMAEIHALLFVSGQSLCTDDVMAQLHVSRGNASTNLRALVDWGLIRREHRFGDRKEYFQADADVWHMFETIMRERRRREVEPILATIDRCREMIAEANATDRESAAEGAEIERRLTSLKDFLTTMGTLFEAMLQVGNIGVTQLAQYLLAPAGPAESPPAVSRPVATPATRPGRARKPKARKARP